MWKGKKTKKTKGGWVQNRLEEDFQLVKLLDQAEDDEQLENLFSLLQGVVLRAKGRSEHDSNGSDQSSKDHSHIIPVPTRFPESQEAQCNHLQQQLGDVREDEKDDDSLYVRREKAYVSPGDG